MLNVRLLLCFLLPFMAYAQFNRVGMALDLGFSKMESDIHQNFDNEWKVLTVPSFNAGITVENYLNRRLSLFLDMKYSHIRSDEVYADVAVINKAGNIIGYTDMHVAKRVSYVILPMYLAYKMGRIMPFAGIRFGLSIGNQAVWHSEYTPDYEESMIIKQYDFGPQLGLSYIIKTRWLVNLNYYHSVVNIIDEENPYNVYYKIRQLTFGLLFFLTKPTGVEPNSNW